MKRRSAVLGAIALLLGALILGAHLEHRSATVPEPIGPSHVAYWEDTIQRFERRDQERPPRPGSVLFVGSSSIRLWETLAEDMEPLAVVNRGFGGSQVHHATHFFDRIVAPYAPRGIVFYAGDNDMARHAEMAPQELAERFEDFVATVEQAGLHAPIYFVSIKPSLARTEHWPRMAEANRLIAAFAAQHPGVTYLDVATPMLGSDGMPRAELFADDGLHLNRKGYALWTRIIAPVLLRDLGADAS